MEKGNSALKILSDKSIGKRFLRCVPRSEDNIIMGLNLVSLRRIGLIRLRIEIIVNAGLSLLVLLCFLYKVAFLF